MSEVDPLAELPPKIAKHTDSYYDLLDVSYNAQTETIKQAYRNKIRQYHPDTSNDPHAEEITFALNRAVDTLTTRHERMLYNELGHQEYHETRSATNTDTTDGSDSDEDVYRSSIYDLITLAKVQTYSDEVWWRILIQTNGFKLFVGVVISIAMLFSVLLVI